MKKKKLKQIIKQEQILLEQLFERCEAHQEENEALKEKISQLEGEGDFPIWIEPQEPAVWICKGKMPIVNFYYTPDYDTSGMEIVDRPHTIC